MIVYLDTHVVVLATSSPRRLPKRALSLVRRADALKISPATVLELQLLREIGRLNASPAQFIEAVAEALPLSVCERPFAAVANAALALSWTRDPFDRLIVAQAAIAECALVTKDETIRKHFSNARWD